MYNSVVSPSTLVPIAIIISSTPSSLSNNFLIDKSSGDIPSNGDNKPPRTWNKPLNPVYSNNIISDGFSTKQIILVFLWIHIVHLSSTLAHYRHGLKAMSFA